MISVEPISREAFYKRLVELGFKLVKRYKDGSEAYESNKYFVILDYSTKDYREYYIFEDLAVVDKTRAFWKPEKMEETFNVKEDIEMLKNIMDKVKQALIAENSRVSGVGRNVYNAYKDKRELTIVYVYNKIYKDDVEKSEMYNIVKALICEILTEDYIYKYIEFNLIPCDISSLEREVRENYVLVTNKENLLKLFI
ncbi:hypothetical protein [Saccharolobus caldissimus]|uniref:Uncharacterized protein n=1 Tax=Saccharolobus caldissimus TaxID=1702097 RepID=A0AAQ4CSB4_9CREN|nr:hypothetical protein [Saccharolobus caldissimus]BDB98695.1 hypothetical protein SACC_17120 [Saccharolobus caldissimus]